MMSNSKNIRITKYKDVNEVLELLSTNLLKILGKKLYGLYLTGSLTYGDFEYGSSDIDFLAVLTNKLTPKQLMAIKAMHKYIGQKVPYWENRLEGSYIPKNWLDNIKSPFGKRPYVNRGDVNMYKYGNEWLLNLHALHEHGVAIVGEDPKRLIHTVNISDVKEASRKNLYEEWAPKLKEKNPFTSSGYGSSHLQTYAILTMCRVLYMAKNDKAASKRVASEWVKKTYGSKWYDLVDAAENWKHGIKLDVQNETKLFIKFVTEEVDTVQN